MSNPRNLQSRAGNSIVLCLLSSVFFLLCLTSNVALASGEGSTSNPVLIGVDSPHQGSVGGDIYSSYSSYYYFKTNGAGGYAIRLTNTHSKFAFNLFSDQFVSRVDDNGCHSYEPSNGDKTCVYNLAANSYYYVSAMDWDFVADTFTITVNDVKSEGSPGTPVPIADGASHAGMVDAASSSYYSFTPASSSAYTLAITDTNYSGSPLFNDTPLQIDTYAGADFSTGLLRSCTPYYGAIYCTVNGLTQGVPVYIKISGKPASQPDTIFTVTPSKAIGEGSVANPVALAVGSLHAGGVAAGSNLYYQGCQNPSYSYYSFNTAAGSGGYTVTTDNADTDSVRMELFHSFSGTSLASCDYLSQVKPCMFSNIDPDSNYYLRIRNCNDVIVNYNILVNKEGSEGSVNNPVHLTLETSHAGALGYYETSYFTFTTDRSGTYTIVLDQSLIWAYTPSPDFVSGNVITNGYNTTYVNLDANKTYYLRVSYRGNPGILLYNVKVAHGASEGSIANPVSLPVGTAYRATVGSSGKSYYTFTTLAAADYYVTFDNPTALAVHAYTNPDFSNGTNITACPGPGPYFSCTLENLAANTPYYIEAHEWSDVNAAFNIHIYMLDHLAGCSAGSECYNFENDVTAPFILTSNISKGKQPLWVIDSAKNAATVGTRSLKSGTLAYDQTTPQSTCFAYTRAASTYSVLFSLMVNASTWNTLEFSIDGTVQPSGIFYNMPLWKRVMFFPTPGQHTYKWCYTKNDPYLTGLDAAWVDDIEFTSPLVLVNGLGSSFATIQDAELAAVANAMTNPVLKARAVTFDGPFTFDTPADVTLKGGLDPAFTSVTGYSYLKGPVKVTAGSLKVQNVVIR